MAAVATRAWLLVTLIALARGRPQGPLTSDEVEAEKVALEKWSRTLSEREAAIRKREKELGLGSSATPAGTRLRADLATAPKERLIFEDTFEDLNTDVWVHDITMAGGGNWEFQYYTNNRSNSFVEDGVLYLQPTLTRDTIGIDNVMGVEPFRMDLWGMWPSDSCTSNAFYGCERISNEAARLVINPVQSARLRTTGTFTFKYGRLEVEAKLPRGDWLWPAIWLLPEKNKYGQWPASGEIDLMESRGNKPGYPKGGYDSFGSCAHWGPYFSEDKYPLTCQSYTLPKGQDFNKAFHVFGLVWTENEMYTYLDTDSNRILEVKFNESFYTRGKFADVNADNPWRGRPNAAPFDEHFYLILNVAVGGLSAFFTDGVDGKPWTNTGKDAPFLFAMAEDHWYPTWAGKDSALQIKSVRVWQQEGAIDYRLGSQAVSSTSGSGSSYLPSGSAPPSSAPIYTPHSSPAAPHQPSRSHAGEVVGWVLGTMLVMLIIGGAVGYGLYLKMGGWGYTSVSTASSGAAGSRSALSVSGTYQAVPASTQSRVN